MSETVEKNPYALVLTVGGNPSPLIESIKYYKPEYGIFICSKDSIENINDILLKSGGIPKHQTIVVDDHQDLLSCVRDIRTQVPVKLKDMKLPKDTFLIADFTGGTKVMSAALTLAMMEFKSRFSYVGGDKRTKVGLGIVEDGHEKIYSMVNPWDVMGIREARDLVNAFNSGQFGAAMNLANFLKKTDNEYSLFYEGLAYIIQAYDNWDKFNYRDAKKSMLIGIKKLQVYNTRHFETFQPLYAALEKDLRQLEILANDMDKLQGKFEPLAGDEGQAYLYDLLANAIRRGKLGQYDDAVARLYSVVEKTAKIALARKGINNSNVRKEELAGMGEALNAKFAGLSGIDEQKIQLDRSDSYAALGALEPDNPVYLTYLNNEDELANTLASRNMSLLAHGFNPVSEDAYNKLRDIVLRYLDIEDKDLPAFPHITLSQVLF